MRLSYSKHYRRILLAILKHLDFSSNNELHRPVVRALELLKKYVEVKSTQVHLAPRKEDLRELTPLIYSNATPYGLIGLDMTERLAIEQAV